MTGPNDVFRFPRRDFEVRNRAIVAAMTNKQSHEDGSLSDAEIEWLRRRAEGGFGIVTTAASHVVREGQGWVGEMGVWGDHQLPGLQRMATGIQAHGALSLAQIFLIVQCRNKQLRNSWLKCEAEPSQLLCGSNLIALSSFS